MEEHSQIGGLGAAIAEIISENNNNRPFFKRFAIKDEYLHFVGDQNYLREQCGLSGRKIAKAVINYLK